jgi:hypothetical protein
VPRWYTHAHMIGSSASSAHREGKRKVVAKKTTKTRRDPRPRLNQAQLQAYRTRKAETIIAPRPVQESGGFISTFRRHLMGNC